MEISQQITEIDLPQILESEGVELHRSGNGYQFLCPFHDDRHPSGSLYRKTNKWRWHCFTGCGGGDGLDFIQKLHGLDFKGALQYLGVKPGLLTHSQKVKIKKHKQRRRIIETFKEWELAAIDELRDTIFTAYGFSGRWKTIEQFETGAMWLDPLADLQGQLSVLMGGSEGDRVGVYRRWKDRGNRF